MATKLAIHIPQEASPENVTALIAALAESGNVFPSVDDLMAYAEDLGIGSRGEIQFTAQNMGLIEKTANGLQLSHAGRAFAQIKESARGDVLHYLIYSGWQSQSPNEFLPSWAYRYSCDKYWQLGTVDLSEAYLEQQVTEIVNYAESFFAELGLNDFEEISFSKKSLRGAKKWLTALTPPVINDTTFERRAFCPPELMLLAIGYVMRDEPEAVDVDILLSHTRREEICRVCLLDPTAFDQTLDWMIPFYPKVIASTEDAGFYGRYIRLTKRPSLGDITR
jgi:hypothetical protein